MARTAVILVLTAMLALALALAIELLDRSSKQRVLTLLARDVAGAAALLRERANDGEARCRPVAPEDDIDALVGALAAVEQLAASPIEGWAEELGARLLLAAGAPLPDLSLGPLQIKPSTARSALAAAGAATLFPGPLDDAQLARLLFDRCHSHALGRVVVLHVLANRASTEGPVAPAQSALTRAAVHSVAAQYNGQAQPRSLQAALAHQLYRELVYHVFVGYRFDRLGHRAPS